MKTTPFKHSPMTVLTLAAFLGAMPLLSAAEVEELHQTYPLEKTGTVRLDNINGTVHVTAWDRDEVKLDVVKRAKTQRDLEEVKIEVDAKPDGIRIKTKYPEEHKNNSTSVDYRLTVPRHSQLDKIRTVNGGVEVENVRGKVAAESVNGSVTATGLAGRAELSTVNGSAKASFDALKEGASIKSVNGAASITLPADVKADISASTVNGGISSEFPVQALKSSASGRRLDGKLGDGGPAVKVSTVNGGIRINRGKSIEAEAK